MMELNKNNYEVWMIDWIEGNLSSTQEKALVQFLDQHPELEVLTPDSELSTLSPSGHIYPDKAELFRTEFSIPEANDDEMQCIARIEGDMTHEEKVLFDKNISYKPGLAALFEQFDMAKLHPEESVIFSDKKILKRKKNPLPVLIYGVIASAAALVLGWFVFNPVFTQKEYENIAGDSTRQIIYLDKLAHPAHFDKIASVDPAKDLSKPIVHAEEEKSTFIREPVYKMENISSIKPVLLTADKQRLNLQYSLADNLFVIDDSDDYESLVAFTGEVIRERILGQDSEMVKNTRFSFWELVDVGMEQAAGFFNLSLDLERSYDDDGKLVSIEFDSPLLAFTTPVRKVKTGILNQGL